MRSTILTLATCIVVCGCATQPAVDVDYDTTKDFSTLKTYQWMPATGNAASDELLVGRIRNAVDSQLQAKGHTLVQSNPDFLVAMQLSGRTAYGGSTGVGMSVGIPVGSRGRISVGGGKDRKRTAKPDCTRDTETRGASARDRERTSAASEA